MKTEDTKTVLVQVGNLGPSVIDHLISPIAAARNVGKVLVFCHHRGPDIPNIEYRCPPGPLSRFVVVAAAYEACDLLLKAVFTRKAAVAGFYLCPHGLLAFVAARLTGKKAIVSLIAGRPELYMRESIRGIDFNSTCLPWRGRALLSVLKHSDGVITTGSVTRDFLIERGVRSDRVHAIISPANGSRFRPVKLAKRYDLLSVGYLSEIKHHEVLLRAASEVKRRFPTVRACVVGDGPRKRELARLAEELGIAENVHFAGYQDNVPDYYNRSRIFVHTSETEGFPNVFLEAMMCGLPSVVSKCGDIVDLARDGHNSFVIDKYDDYRGFAGAICRLLENQEIYDAMAENALLTVGQCDVEGVTRHWEAVLDEARPGV